ncbi:MAG: hypothetical protein QM533_01045 [Cytophagales bacterium]|nr:hypothetical protein [Cytophagales bacterium]
MLNDEIVENIHAVRAQLLQQVGGNVRVLYEQGNKIAKDLGMRFIQTTPRRPEGWIQTLSR